jgi:hypothetical protein
MRFQRRLSRKTGAEVGSLQFLSEHFRRLFKASILVAETFLVLGLLFMTALAVWA